MHSTASTFPAQHLPSPRKLCKQSPDINRDCLSAVHRRWTCAVGWSLFRHLERRMIACDDKENVLTAKLKTVVSGLMLLAPVRRVVLHIYSSRIDRLPWTEMNYDTSAMNFDQVYFKDWNPPGSFF